MYSTPAFDPRRKHAQGSTRRRTTIEWSPDGVKEPLCILYARIRARHDLARTWRLARRPTESASHQNNYSFNTSPVTSIPISNNQKRPKMKTPTSLIPTVVKAYGGVSTGPQFGVPPRWINLPSGWCSQVIISPRSFPFVCNCARVTIFSSWAIRNSGSTTSLIVSNSELFSRVLFSNVS